LHNPDFKAVAALINIEAAVNQLISSGVCSLSNGTVTCGNVQMGAGAQASGSGSVAIGDGATSTNGAVAIGESSTILGSGSGGAVAIGKGAVANSNPAVAIGDNAQATGASSVAIGSNSTASAQRSVAIGHSATATHYGAVAIGYGSVTSADNTVSVGGGAVGNRRITNVADPILANDAATKGYVDSLFENAGGGAQALGQANAYTDKQISVLRRETYRGIAQAAALIPMAPSGPGETTVNVGIGSYGGEHAVGIAFARQLNSVTINAGLSAANGSKTLMRVGLGWRF